MTLATQPKLVRCFRSSSSSASEGTKQSGRTCEYWPPRIKTLDAKVAAGLFRHDLLYRLKVFTIYLPALRERREDLPLLIGHFLRQLNVSLGKHVTSVSPEAMHVFEKYAWPGNVRELQSAIKYAYVQSAGEVITPECLPAPLRDGALTARGPVLAGEAGRLDVADFVNKLLQGNQPDIYTKVSSAVDRVVVETVLRHVRGNQVQASELLGISRTTLRAKLRSLGLAIEKQLLPEPNQGE